MKKIEVYKTTNKILEEFLRRKRIVILIDKEKKNNTKEVNTVKINHIEIKVYIIKNDISKMIEKEVEKIVREVIENHKIKDCLYTSLRTNIKKCEYLSKRLDIKMTNLSGIDKDNMVLYHYYKIRGIKDKLGIHKFKDYINKASDRQGIQTIFKNVGYENISDYLYLTLVKNTIILYQKEVDKNIDIKNPSVSNKMILKYIDNFFSKKAIVTYNEELVENFLFNYYGSKIEANDMTRFFVNDLLEIYKIISKYRFSVDNMYNFRWQELFVFREDKVKELKYKDFYQMFDKVTESEENYYNFLFMLEILEPGKYKSSKKEILNYINVISILLLKGKFNLSEEFIFKIEECLHKKHIYNFTKDELKCFYNYRSKLTHGCYFELLKKLEDLSKFKSYKLNKIERKDLSCLSELSIIERKAEHRLSIIINCLLTLYFEDNDYITELKNRNIQQK